MTFLAIADLLPMTSAEWDALVRGKGSGKGTLPPWVDPAKAPQPDVPPTASTERVMPARALRQQVQHIGVGR
jgi:hypothetical protein